MYRGILNICKRSRTAWLAVPVMQQHKHTLSRSVSNDSGSVWNNRKVQSTLNQVNQLAPRFRLEKGAVNVIYEPDDFYQTLKTKISNAKKRIFLASLYIGANENEFVQCIDQALAKNPELQVHILTDALRGTRGEPKDSCASILAPLITKFGAKRVLIHMYHTPNLHGVAKTFVPQRFNEGWGLQHMKLYGFDDEIILSGANLSSDYFSNRQDRYLLFRSPELASYYFNIFETVSSISYRLEPRADLKSKFELFWPHHMPEPTDNPEAYILEATRRLARLLKPIPEARKEEHQQEPEPGQAFGKDQEETEYTYVYPISQFSQVLSPDTSTEFPVLSRLLSMLGVEGFNWTLTAGYFNIHPEFKDKLMKSKPSLGAQVFVASPEANGFYKSKGVSSLLPGAYSYLAEKFLDAVVKAGKRDYIKLYEWKNGVAHTANGWTYHAKGIWVSLPDQTLPCITVVGSSNYTRRAYTHDLESNVLLVTSDKALQQDLSREVEHLKQHVTGPLAPEFYKENPDRRPNWKQRLFCKYFGDKL